MAKEFRVGSNAAACKCKSCTVTPPAAAPVTPAPKPVATAQSTNIVPSPANDALEQALRKHRDSNTITREQALSEALTKAINPVKETK